MPNRHGDQASKILTRSQCTRLGQAAALGRGALVLDHADSTHMRRNVKGQQYLQLSSCSSDGCMVVHLRS